MKTSLRNTIVAGTVAAGLLSGGGLAFAQQSTTTPAEQGADAAATARPDRAAHQAERANDLATRLGLTNDQVTAAREAAKAAVEAQFGPRPERPTTPPTDEEKAAMDAGRQARHDLFEQTFADELGVTAEQLQAAKEAGFQAHLADEVASGQITQEQADARLQAMQNGERPPGGPGGRGHGGPPPADAPAGAPAR